ncbi:MAG: hypothetical protein GC159_15440 [Phycisphaera sp.]|nr:hypothetical protein [Phycisphaera sp.]
MPITRRRFVQGSLAAGAAAFAAPSLFAADKPAYVPGNYELVYEQDFKSDAAAKDFVFTDPKAWRQTEAEGHRCLELFGKSKYAPKVRSPLNIALVNDLEVGDYVIEADLRQTGKEYGHRDMCLFYSFVDPSHFYYTHIATKTDPHAHNIFIVNDQPRLRISEKNTDGFDWAQTWHHVSLRRTAADGKIEVYADNMDTPIMVAHDKTFARGHVGFGSFDDTGLVSNIRVYSPDAKKSAAGCFTAM